MTNEPRHKISGTPLSKWIERIPNELEIDAVGLWQIIPVFLENFGLSHDGAMQASRKAIIGLIERGAVVVHGVTWIEQPQYGKRSEDIAENILTEWERQRFDLAADGVWFALLEDVQYLDNPLARPHE